MNLTKFNNWLWGENLSKSPKGPEWALKVFLRIIFIVASGFKKHELELRASALTYTVILSLVPVLAMGTALVKGLGADNYMKEAAYRMLDELEEMSNVPLGTSKENSGNSTKVISQNNASTKHLKQAIDKIFDYVDKTNFAALGWLGIVASIFTVVSLMSRIEETMNTIWQTNRTRELGRKVIDYIALIVLLPLSVNFTFWAITATQNEAFFEKIASVLKITWLLPLLFKFLPFFFIISTFTILYRFMPNTWVKFGPAILGGILGGSGWILVQTIYIKLQIGVAKYNAIYGSFATLPLFIFWLYIGWIVFLIGAELSFAIQNYKRLRPLKRPVSPLKEFGLAIDIVEVAHSYLDEGRPVTREILADELGYSISEIDMVVNKLINAGLLVPTEKHEELLPGISKYRLKLSRLFNILCGKPEFRESYGEKIVQKFYENAKKWLDNFK